MSRVHNLQLVYVQDSEANQHSESYQRLKAHALRYFEDEMAAAKTPAARLRFLDAIQNYTSGRGSASG